MSARTAARRARLGDTWLAYDDVGSGPPLVLLHGLACGRRMWWRQRRSYARRYRVIAPDLPGHGESGVPDDPAAYSEDGFADRVVALLDGLGLARVNLIGFSMGAGVALSLVARYPERIGALVLSDVGAGSEEPAASAARAQAWARIAREGGIEAFAQAMIESTLVEDYRRRPHGARHMRALILQHSAIGIARTLEGVLARRPGVYARTGALWRIGVPVLVTLGDRDAACARPTPFVAAHVARASLRIQVGAGHMVPLEQPAAYDAAVLEFLDARSADVPRASRSRLIGAIGERKSTSDPGT